MASFHMPDSLSQGDSLVLPTDTVSKTPKPSETMLTDSQSILPTPTPKPKSSNITSVPSGGFDSADDQSSIHLATSTSLPFSQPTPQPLHSNPIASQTVSSKDSQSAPEAISSSKSDLAHPGQSRSKLESGVRPTLTNAGGAVASLTHAGEVALPSAASRSQSSHHDSDSGSLQPTTFTFVGAIIVVMLIVGFSLWACCRCRERRVKSKRNYYAQGSDTHSFFDKTPPPGFDAYNGLTPVLTRELSRHGRHGDFPNEGYGGHDSSLWQRSEDMGGPESGRGLSIREEKFDVKSLYQDLDFGPLVTPHGASTPHLMQPYEPQFEAVRRAPTPSAALGVTNLGYRSESFEAVPAAHSTNINSSYLDYKGVTPLYQSTPHYTTLSQTGNSNTTEERVRHKKDTIVGLAEAYGNANGWAEVELEPMPELRYPYQGDHDVQAKPSFTLQLNEHTTLPYASTPTLPLPAYHANPMSTSARSIQPAPHIIYQPFTRYNLSPSGGTTAFQNVRDHNDISQFRSQNQAHGQNSLRTGKYPYSSDSEQQLITSAASPKATENAPQTPGTQTLSQPHDNSLSDFPSHLAQDSVFKPPHPFGGAALGMQHEYPPTGPVGTIVTGQTVTNADLLPPIQPSPALNFPGIECSLSSPTFTTMNHAFESPVSFRAESSSLAQILGLSSVTRTDHMILGTPYGSTFQPSNQVLNAEHAQNPYQGIVIPGEEAYGTPWQADPPPTSNTPGPIIPQGQMNLDTNVTHYHSPTLSVYDMYRRTIVPSHFDVEVPPPGVGPSETLK